MASTKPSARRRRFPRGGPFFGVVLTLIAAFFVYVGLRLVPDGWPAGAQVAAWLALSSLVFVPVAMLLVVMRGLADERLFSLALLPLGLFIFTLTFTVVRDLLWLLATIGGIARPDRFDLTSALVVAAALLTFVYGVYRARSGPTVVDVEVPIANLHPELHGFTIAQISDVHIGRTLRRPFLERVVAAVNSIEADVVAITGDLVDGHVDDLRSQTEPLADLRARHGVFFVTGNHDYYSGALAWIDELERLGLKVLINRHDVVDHDGTKVVLGGVTDHSASVMVQGHKSDPHQAIAGAPDDAALRVLLAHQPASAAEAAKAGFDLQLSGHTHGGQFFPGTLFAHLVFPFVAGLHKLDKMWIYTHRGTGFVGPPLRTTAIAGEVTRLVLVRA